MASPSTVWAAVGRLLRGLLVAVGIAVFAVGLLAIYVPGVERVLPVAAAVEALGSDYVVVAVVGVAAVGISVVLVAVQAVRGIDESRPAVVESVETAPHPGRDLDRSFGGLSGLTSTGATRARLRDVAVTAVMRAEGCPRSTAERRVQEGVWTDDRVAAAFVAGAGGVGDSDGAGDRLRSLLGVDDRVERTAAAIERTGTDGNDGSTGVVTDPGSEVP